MKLQLLNCVIAVGTWLVPVTAFANRGAAERALIWMAYSLETFLDQGMINSPPATVAPHCVGAGGGRCNLPELLEYLWAPQKGQFETDRPSVTYQLLKLNPIEEFDLFKVYKGTLSFREQRAVLGRGRVVTDLVHNIDYVRISTRATTFGEALGDLGTRIKTAYDECKVHAKDTTHPPGPNALSLEAVQQQIDRIYGMAKQSARSIYLLRRKEYEKTRLEDFGSLKSKVHLPIDPLTGEPYPVKSKTVTIPKTPNPARPYSGEVWKIMNSAGASTFNVLDPTETARTSGIGPAMLIDLVNQYLEQRKHHVYVLNKAKETVRAFATC